MSCHHYIVDGQIDPFWVVFPIGLFCMLCEQFTNAPIMLICNQCSKGCHMDVLCYYLKKYQSKNDFAPGALCKI
jgi:hypothetical protein